MPAVPSRSMTDSRDGRLLVLTVILPTEDTPK
jgi:hypothetical protein